MMGQFTVRRGFWVNGGQRLTSVPLLITNDFIYIKWNFMPFKVKKGSAPLTRFIANTQPILGKYNYTLPVISNQKFNEYLKDIGEIAVLSEPRSHYPLQWRKRSPDPLTKIRVHVLAYGADPLLLIILGKSVPRRSTSYYLLTRVIRSVTKYCRNSFLINLSFFIT